MTRRERFARWLLGTTAPAPAIEPDERPVARGISVAAKWEAMRTGQPVPEPSALFERPVPPPGVLPAGFAMDSNLPALTPLATWGLQSLFHEGLAFPGYSYLAELSQRPEYRHMAEIWAEHATRKWIKLTGPDEDRLGVIEAELDRLNARAVFREADEVDGKFGRAHIYLDFGDGERSPALVADPRKVTPARPLRALRVVEPMWCYPGGYDATDPLSPDFYRPRFWYVQGKTVADSRFLTMVRHPVPNLLKPAYAFGGQSYTQLAKPYVDNWLRTRQSVSDVTSAFSQMVLATDMGSTLTGGTGEDLFSRVDMFNLTRDNRGTMVINKDTEELTNVTTPLSGLDKLQSQAQEQLSSVARIPLSIYLQVTPTGLNASSEGEIRSFYADVNAHQEKNYRPGLQRLIELVQLGIDGKIDPDVKFTFEPLWEMSAVDAATVRKTEAETDAVYVTMGAIGNDEVREKLREEDGGPYQGVDLSGDVPDTDDIDTDPVAAQDEWNESAHPRDENGRFNVVHAAGEAFRQHFTDLGEKVGPIEHSVNRHGESSSYFDLIGGPRIRVSDHEANQNFRGNERSFHHEAASRETAEKYLAQLNANTAEYEEKRRGEAEALAAAKARRDEATERERQADIRFSVYARLAGHKPEALRGSEKKAVRAQWAIVEERAVEKHGEAYYAMTGEARKDALREAIAAAE